MTRLPWVDKLRVIVVAAVIVAHAALAYVVWGEALRGIGYAGAALVLAGVLVVATERAAGEAVAPPHEGPAPDA